MKNLFLLLVLLIASFNVSAEIEYHCYEITTTTDWASPSFTEISCDASNLISVDATGFDSTLSVLNSNWYSTIEYTDIDKNDFYFYEDSIWESTEIEYTQFSAYDSGIYDSSNGSAYSGYYYATSNSEFVNDGEYESIIKLYRFEDDTVIAKSGNATDGYVITNTGSKGLSSIKFGTSDQKCEYTFTDKITDGEIISSTLLFSTCPATITAVNNDDGNTYEFYSSLDNVSADLENLSSSSYTTRELLNSSNEQIGYLNFDLASGEYYLTDNDGNSFSN